MGKISALIMIEEALEDYALKERNETSVSFKVMYSRFRKRLMAERSRILKELSEEMKK